MLYKEGSFQENFMLCTFCLKETVSTDRWEWGYFQRSSRTENFYSCN